MIRNSFRLALSKGNCSGWICPSLSVHAQANYCFDSWPTYISTNVSSPSLWWPPATQKSQTTYHPASGLKNHNRCVKLGSKNDKTRLLTPVCSQVTSPQRSNSNFVTIFSISACKRSNGNGSSSEQQIRLLQPLLSSSQERWRAQAHSRSPLVYEMTIQFVDF